MFRLFERALIIFLVFVSFFYHRFVEVSPRLPLPPGGLLWEPLAKSHAHYFQYLLSILLDNTIFFNNLYHGAAE